jgi:hypothetical protein
LIAKYLFTGSLKKSTTQKTKIMSKDTNYNQSQLREFEDPKGIINNINSKIGQIIPQPKEEE